MQQPMLTHHPLHAFAVHRLTELACRERGDHPGAVGRVRSRDLDDPGVTRPATPRPSRRRAGADRPVERLARDPRHTGDDGWFASGGDHGAGSGHADAHVQTRESTPATSSS